jgi:quercetin dioxygenase-like cupin family protein
MIRPAIVRHANEGRLGAVVGDLYRFFATGDDTDGKYAMWEATVPPGGGPPPHVHTREEECFYVLEGEVTFYRRDSDGAEQTLVAGPGMFVGMPIGTPHTFKNASGRTAKMIITVAPAGLEKMFFEIAQPVEPGATTAPPPTQQEIEKLIAIAPNYGIELLLHKH